MSPFSSLVPRQSGKKGEGNLRSDAVGDWGPNRPDRTLSDPTRLEAIRPNLERSDPNLEPTEPSDRFRPDLGQIPTLRRPWYKDKYNHINEYFVNLRPDRLKNPWDQGQGPGHPLRPRSIMNITVSLHNLE